MSQENKMIDFLSELEKDKQREEDRKKITDSTDYKFRVIDKKRDEAREVCLDTLFSKLYKNSIPMDDAEKDMPYQELDKEFKDFIKLKCPKGTSYYVQEAIKKGSKPAKTLMESVNRLLIDHFGKYALNINETSVDEIQFDVEDPEIEQKLQDISSNMEFDELSDVIQNNVKVAANNEINRVKEERQKIKDLEDSLKQDEEVTSESAIERKLVVSGYKDPNSKIYQPTLFEGVMINKLNLVKESGVELDPMLVNQLAFTEAVKEYTKLSILKSFMLESFKPYDVNRLATRYATMKESGEISVLREDRVNMYEEMITEGANLDARVKFKRFKIEYKDLMKSAKHDIKLEKYDSAIKKLEKSKKLLRKTYEDILDDGSTIGSTVIAALFTGGFPFVFHDIISVLLCIPTFGIAGIARDIEKLVVRVKVLIDDINKRGFDPSEDLNLNKNAIKARIVEYEFIVDETIKKVKMKKKNS